MLRVSVIVPSYNCASFLPAAVESVFVQTMRDCEVIVVDDGSTDSTREVVQRYADRADFRYIYQKNAGQSSARNHAAQISSAEYIAFLDADDSLDPDALRLMCEAMDRTRASWCIIDIVKVIGERREVRRTAVPENPFHAILREDFIRRAMFFRRADFVEVGMFDLSLAQREDWDINIRMFEKRKPFVYLREPLYIYHWREGSCTTSQYDTMLSSTQKVLRKTHKRLADAGDPAIARIYADNMWDLGRNYLRLQRDCRQALHCARESLAYDMSIGRIVHPFVHYFRQSVKRLNSFFGAASQAEIRTSEEGRKLHRRERAGTKA